MAKFLDYPLELMLTIVGWLSRFGLLFLLKLIYKNYVVSIEPLNSSNLGLE